VVPITFLKLETRSFSSTEKVTIHQHHRRLNEERLREEREPEEKFANNLGMGMGMGSGRA
jgi:tartrate dehydratase alpha subunit/fumarate hydratase class I-like protein